ncbi:MAG: GxxExxY protein [Ignavibacteriales bacterium]|nr:GxxExxY protein [Ignavibacteriales bacterium]
MKGFSEKDYPKKDLTEKIINAAFTVHNRLGAGFAEKIYENALVKELESKGLKAEQQKRLQVIYGGNPVGDFIVDLLVEESVVVELKAVRVLDKSFEDQLLNYLKTSGLEVGLLLNFGTSVQIKRKVVSKK